MSKGKKYNIPHKYLHKYPVRKWNINGCRRRFQLEQLTSGLKYPQSIVDAVNAKNAAIQKAQKAQNELAVVKAEAEKKVVAAQAEAEANKLRTQALTPLILKQQWIEKWNGEIPTVVSGGNSGVFLDVSKMVSK